MPKVWGPYLLLCCECSSFFKMKHLFVGIEVVLSFSCTILHIISRNLLILDLVTDGVQLECFVQWYVAIMLALAISMCHLIIVE